jgi:hypothetical protein
LEGPAPAGPIVEAGGVTACALGAPPGDAVCASAAALSIKVAAKANLFIIFRELLKNRAVRANLHCNAVAGSKVAPASRA